MKEKAAKIKLLFLDVDGVLTDGKITMNEQGEEIKSFDVKDGQGLKMLISEGIETALISGRRSKIVSLRAQELGITELHQGITDKKNTCKLILAKHNLTKEEVCAVGDDLPDLEMFDQAGLCIAVADAVKEIREAADMITTAKGGAGAVREVCELLLKSRGKWPNAL